MEADLFGERMTDTNLTTKKFSKKDLTEIREEPFISKILFLMKESNELFFSIKKVSDTSNVSKIPCPDTIIQNVSELLSQTNQLFKAMEIAPNSHRFKVEFKNKDQSLIQTEIDDFMILLSLILNCNVYFDNEETFILF